ncbi:DUF2336 domain-containing protein [Sphingomonas sp. IC-11]|uniref:DUF2336 domain-containing protein n=1 Tax=Sphingomonas sp. IC-11 TaxID=2898528 RepID=UPI001E2C0DAF|nr:DUF2336 domain-containing protein [Sphingomonas sp. IC-11]MCD2314708.1 DUF2336 domain-containing protein [Sphingomonas sp. IC-11]
MSVDQSDASQACKPQTAPLLARAAAAAVRSDVHLASAIQDFFLAEGDRLDDRTRAATAATLRAILHSIAHDLTGHAAEQLAGHAVEPCTAALPRHAAAGALVHRLYASGLLRDRGLMEELFAQARQDILSDALLVNRAPGATPSFLPALSAGSDEGLADAAIAYLHAENARRAGGRSDVPGPLRERLTWWAAAVLREKWSGGSSGRIAIDRAIAGAAQHSISAYRDDDRLEAIADRLAALLRPGAAELSERLVQSLEEGHLALFVALLAQVLAVDAREIRALLLDPAGEQLSLALRAAGLDRAAIARVGFLLTEADPRRDIEAFADTLDVVAMIAPEEALEGLALLTLPTDFRAAVRALDRAVAR